MVKHPPASSGDAGSMPGLRRFPGGGNGNLLQCSCLENLMDRGAWRFTVHRVAKNQTGLNTQPYHQTATRNRNALLLEYV